MENRMKKMGLVESFSIYFSAALMMLLVTRHLIPFLSRATGQEMVLYWFLAAGFFVFLPLVVAAYFILKSEGYGPGAQTWTRRLRFAKLTRQDLKWTFLGLFLVIILSGIVLKGFQMIIGKFDPTPTFMSFKPLSSGRYWLLAVWFPYWILNILGEEILWRGVMLPRQEVAFGKKAWAIHAVGWGVFHVAFGWKLLITLLPILFVQPFIVQKTKNSWAGVIIHALINGPSFIAIAFGLIQ